MVRPGPGMAFLLLVVLMAAVLGACAAKSTPPGPTMAAGLVGQAGYEFLKWEEGLGLLIWHDAPGSCMSAATGSTVDPTYRVHGECEAHDGRRFNWEVQTTDGRYAQLTIDNTVSEIRGGLVVLVRTRGEEAGVRQLQHDLSAIQTNRESIAAFAERNPDIAAFIQGIPSPQSGPVVP